MSTPVFEQQIFRPAFWKYFKAQDETFPNSIYCRSQEVKHDYAYNDHLTRVPTSWLAECKARRLASRKPWPDERRRFSTDRIECRELKGDVLFTVGNTGSKDYVVCAGESGTIYFVEQELNDRSPVMKFVYKAHDATIYALHLRKELKEMEGNLQVCNNKPWSYRRFQILSGDAIGRVRMDMVDPDKDGRSYNGTVTPVKDFFIGRRLWRRH